MGGSLDLLDPLPEGVRSLPQEGKTKESVPSFLFSL